MNISVKIGNVVFPNPVTVASGTFGHAEDFYGLEEVKRLGAIVPKTVTLYAQQGNPPKRICETPAGMINAIGIENPGVDAFIIEKLPKLRKIGVPLIVSISAHSDDDFILMVEKLNAAGGLSAIELNLSCPNLQKKVLIAQSTEATASVVGRVKAIAKYPVIAKLSPNVTSIVDIALAAEAAGADAVSMVNTFTAMAIDIKKCRSRIGNFTGGLSGPAIRPIAVRMVCETAAKVKIPVIGMGGITCANDALEFLIAGATMVAVGTYNFVNPRAPLEVLDGIKAYMKENKMTDIRELIGRIQKI
ncbi:MAG: dihydroorotate dehydrogenase [Candidatus Omnitrophica bacterium]|nr:dihydroorotate dehydrogenase [Candidatus Omnitrophota bacterium]